MDIPDIDLVVVYGIPNAVSQLYQMFLRLFALEFQLHSVYLYLYYSCVVELVVMAVQQESICLLLITECQTVYYNSTVMPEIQKTAFAKFY